MKVEIKESKSLQKEMKKLIKKSKTLKVGFFKNAKYPDGTNVADVAYWNEYGTSTSPARPFFRTAIRKNSKKWVENFKKDIEHFDFDYDKALSLLGVDASNDIRESIIDWSEPANSPATIKRKGFNDPLVETHNMEKSVNWELDNESSSNS